MKGFKTYRHNTNPLEKQLHDSFVDEHVKDGYMDLIVFGPRDGSDTQPSDYLTDREKQIVISTVQWMGSPVGQGFLRQNGIEKVKEQPKQEVVIKKVKEIDYFYIFMSILLGIIIGYKIL